MRPANVYRAIKWKAFLLASLLLIAGRSFADPLYDALLQTPPKNIPEGYSNPSISPGVIEEADKNAGVVGFVQLTFENDPKARVNYVFFPSEEQARQYSSFIGQQIAFSNGERKLLPYLPKADCVDREEGALCDLAQDQICVIALASKVDGGAAPLIKMAVDHLDAVKKTIPVPENVQPSNSDPISDKLDPCTLVLQADAEATLGNPVREARRDSANACFYGSQSNPGDSVMIQLIDGGPEKFEFDRSRVSKPVTLTGIEDQAFAFVSDGGFVQLSLVKGMQYIKLMVNKRKDSKLLEATKELAIKVSSRLPASAIIPPE